MSKYFQLVLVALSLISLAGCSEIQLASHMIKRMGSDTESKGMFKIGNPYKINGVWYRPAETYNFSETGIASWYGPQFHGKHTANGETFDMNELTAAHRTLQLPSIVRVTNLENGRSLIVRVNDRGPFARGRVIDLSRKSAELLGFKNKGTARVKLEVLPEESRKIAALAKQGQDTKGTEVAMNDEGLAGHPGSIKVAASVEKPTYKTPVVPQPVQQEMLSTPNFKGHMKGGNILPDPIVQEVPVVPTNIYVQVGAFSDKDNAVGLANMLQKYANAQVYPAFVDERQFFRVRLGPVGDVAEADQILASLVQDGQPQAVIVVE